MPPYETVTCYWKAHVADQSVFYKYPEVEIYDSYDCKFNSHKKVLIYDGSTATGQPMMT